MFDLGHRHAQEYVEIKSSLSLQMLMYYQGFYSLLYLCISGGCMMNKNANYAYGNAILELLTIPVFLLWSITEFARVFLGYFGNIKERVPMISAFLLLTIFPQIVAVAFFTFLQDPIFPFDIAGGIIMLIFLISELIVGKRSLDMLIQRQTAQFFRLIQEEELHRICNHHESNSSTAQEEVGRDIPTVPSSTQEFVFNPLRQRRRRNQESATKEASDEERRSLLADQQEPPSSSVSSHFEERKANNGDNDDDDDEKKPLILSNS